MVSQTHVTLRNGSEVIVDITSITGAENFVISQNRGLEPEDPFARQCFVELIQSLTLMPSAYVIHPTLPSPRAIDFGERPRLLQALFKRGLVRPLQMRMTEWDAAQRDEHDAIARLQSSAGLTALMRFIEQANICDMINGSQASLSQRLRRWSEFQERHVHFVTGHHGARIDTRDGIENDAYGEWARATAVVLRRALRHIAAPDADAYLMATLVRGIKYSARAEASCKLYQSHPMRRDFSLTFELAREGATGDLTLDVVKIVRGIRQSLAEAAGESHARLKLLEIELPLLGGRLWHPSESGTLSDSHWIEHVTDRILDYRTKTTDVRRVIERCVTYEDKLRLSRDVEEVKKQLLERLGLRRIEFSADERDLVDNVASVAEATSGLPKVSGLWFGARAISKRFGFTGNQFQRFLYKEFLDAWKRAGR